MVVNVLVRYQRALSKIYIREANVNFNIRKYLKLLENVKHKSAKTIFFNSFSTTIVDTKII